MDSKVHRHLNDLLQSLCFTFLARGAHMFVYLCTAASLFVVFQLQVRKRRRFDCRKVRDVLQAICFYMVSWGFLFYHILFFSG